MSIPISSSDSADWRLDFRLFGVPLTDPELCLDGCVGNDERRIRGGGLAPNRRKADRCISKDLALFIGYLGRNLL